MNTAHDELTCAICGETEEDPQLLMDCNSCGSFFHLNPFQNREGKDCGNVLPGDLDNPVLQFFCNRCLGYEEQTETPAAATPAEGAPPPLEVTERPGGRRFRRIDR